MSRTLPPAMLVAAVAGCTLRPCVPGTGAGDLEMTLLEAYVPGGSFRYDPSAIPGEGPYASCGDLGFMTVGARIDLRLDAPYYHPHCNGAVFDRVEFPGPTGTAMLHPSRQSLSGVSTWQIFAASRRNIDYGGGCTGEWILLLFAREAGTPIDRPALPPGPADFIAIRQFEPLDPAACVLDAVAPGGVCGDVWVAQFRAE